MSQIDRNAVVDVVRNQLAEILEIDASSINEGHSFADDLGADSIALIELVD
jgi:acyl carrier protein